VCLAPRSLFGIVIMDLSKMVAKVSTTEGTEPYKV
jgi:hypothetical protein